MFKKLLVVLSLACTSLATSISTASDKPAAYQLRAGDAVFVSVWREDALQKEVRVLPDGSISFPLAGRIDVSGLSATDVEQRIAAKLKDFIPEPNVTVVITGTNGNLAYVLGKVAKPGPFMMMGPTSVLQALSMAGGLDKFANENAIKVVRTKSSAQGAAQEVFAVSYKELITGQDMKSNVQLLAGDTILVP